MDDERGHATRFVVSRPRAGFLTENPPVHRGEHHNPAAPPPVKPDPVLEGRITARLRPEAGGDWRTLGTNDKKDVDHSMSHAQNGRDIFITNDKKDVEKTAMPEGTRDGGSDTSGVHRALESRQSSQHRTLVAQSL